VQTNHLVLVASLHQLVRIGLHVDFSLFCMRTSSGLVRKPCA
jgi:hypothetical protein